MPKKKTTEKKVKLLEKTTEKKEERIAEKAKDHKEEKDPYDEALEILQQYEEGNPPVIDASED